MVRTNYSNEAAWVELRRQAEARREDGFRANLYFYSDPLLGDLTTDQLVDLVKSGPFRTFFFVADDETLANPEHPVIAVDIHGQPGRTFRVIPSALWSVENNLAIFNMDFFEFADNVDADGVFRGFHR